MSDAVIPNVPVPSALPRESILSPSTVLTLARKEVRESLRNRWFIFYTVAFAILAITLSSLALMGTGSSGLAGFGRTAASLINLVILIVPLMALTAGAGAIAAERERGTLNELLAQPVSRLEVILGKYVGLAIAMASSLALGFGASAAAIAWRSGSADAAGFARLVGLALLLALAMLSLGFLISTLARRASVAMGAAIFTWLAFVFLSDLGLMGSTVLFKLEVSELFRLSLINPLQVFRMASLGAINASLDVLGPAGLYATRSWGDAIGSLFAGILALWAIIPLGVATALFVKRGGA